MKASVIIPVFNAQNTIKECIKALINQSVKPFEIIVVNDGSTDETEKIVKAIKRVKLISQKNSGPAIARNKGARQSIGEIVLFIDSDCIADKNFVKFMLKSFQSKKVVGVQGSYKIKQKELIARYTQIVIEQSYEKMKKLKFIDHIGSYAAAYRRKDFLSFNGFDESFPKASGEDTELSYRMSEAGKKLIFNPKAFVFHFHPTTLEKHLRIKFMRGFYRVSVFKKHSRKMQKDSFIPITIKIGLGLFYLLIVSLFFSVFFKQLFFVSFGLILAMFLTGSITGIFAWKKDKLVAIFAPFIEMLTFVSIGCGFIYGIIRSFLK